MPQQKNWKKEVEHTKTLSHNTQRKHKKAEETAIKQKQLHQQENQEISNQPEQPTLRAATAVNFTTNYKKKISTYSC